MNIRRFAGGIALFVAQMFYAGPGWADTWQSAATARTSVQYETNPAMSAIAPEGVWKGTIEPGYALMGKLGQGEIKTGVAFQVERSSNKTLSPDRDSPSAFLDWSRPSEAGEFGLSTRYAKVATRDSDGVDAAGRVPAASTRTSRTLSGNWNQELTERSTLAVDAGYEGVKYSGGGTFTDYSTRTGGLRFGYDLSEQVNYFLRVSGNRYLPAGEGASISLVDATLGVSWQNESMDLGMQVGRSRVGKGRFGSQGSVSAEFTGQRSLLVLTAGRTVVPSGVGGFLKADQLRGSLSYALSEYTNSGIDLNRNKNSSFEAAPSSTSTSSMVWVDYNLSTFWKIRTSCQRRSLREGAARRVSSNMLGLSLTYSNSDF